MINIVKNTQRKSINEGIVLTGRGIPAFQAGCGGSSPPTFTNFQHESEVRVLPGREAIILGKVTHKSRAEVRYTAC